MEALEQPLTELPERLSDLGGEVARLTNATWPAQRDRLARHARDLAVRVTRRDDPLLVVLAGGTGSGKSTLANTLAQAAVSAVGVRRPTTSTPMVLGRAEDLDTLQRSELLADLRWDEPDGSVGSQGWLRSVPVQSLPAGLCLVDTPDVDSVESINHERADRLLDAADVWMWLATARGYADEAGMAYLRHAAQFDTSVTVVVTQLPARGFDEIVEDATRRLSEAGLDDADVLTIPYVEPEDGQLPAGASADLRAYVDALAAPTARAQRRLRTVTGAAAALPGQIDELLEAVERDRLAVEQLRATVTQTYEQAPEQVLTELREGVSLQNEVVGKWQELIGKTRLQEHMETASGRVSEWMRELVPMSSRDPAGERETATQATEAVSEAILNVLDTAAVTVEAAWQREPEGRLLLAIQPSRRSDESARRRRSERVDELVQQWRAAVVEHVSTVGQQKVTRARRWNAGVNAVVATSALVLFSMTGGLTGGEVALTAGGSATAHTVLKKVLGERTLNSLHAAVTEDLQRRVAELAEQEAAGFVGLLQDACPSQEAVAAVRDVRDRLARAAT